jgi:hypothetical protein
MSGGDSCKHLIHTTREHRGIVVELDRVHLADMAW